MKSIHDGYLESLVFDTPGVVANIAASFSVGCALGYVNAELGTLSNTAECFTGTAIAGGTLTTIAPTFVDNDCPWLMRGLLFVTGAVLSPVSMSIGYGAGYLARRLT